MGGKGISNEATFGTLDDTQGCGGWQNALFKIAAKQCSRLLMMFDETGF